MDYYGHAEYTPTQAAYAYAQFSLSGRFQQYTDTWMDYVAANGTYPKTELMDYGLVMKMKVAMYTGLWDDTFPLTYTDETVKSLGPNTVESWVVAPW